MAFCLRMDRLTTAGTVHAAANQKQDYRVVSR